MGNGKELQGLGPQNVKMLINKNVFVMFYITNSELTIQISLPDDCSVSFQTDLTRILPGTFFIKKN